METQNLKYLALGILVAIVAPYVVALIKKPQPAQKPTSEEESDEKEKPDNES